MKKIRLNQNVEMPVLGLGTFLNENPDEIRQTILEALEIGYRHIDTAQVYNNEKNIGAAIKESNIPREEIFITTKIKNCKTKEELRETIDESFANLQTDYIDLMLIHWPSHDYDLNYMTYSVLEEYYEKGLFKAIGVSNYTIHHLNDLLSRCKVKPVINQVELHPGLNQVPLQAYLDSKGIAIQSYGPFMKGDVFKEPHFAILKDIAKKYDRTVGEVVIAWGLKRNIVMIPKSSNYDRLKINFSAKDLVLDDEDVITINNLNRARRVYSDPDNNNNYMK